MKKYKKRRKFPFPFKLLLFFLFLSSFFFFILIQYDTKIFQAVIEISHIQSKAAANIIIDNAVEDTIKELNITSSDFFIEKQQDNVSVNTLLINTFCSSVSTGITEGLSAISEEKILIPMGIITGIDMFANTGPNIPFSLRPMGAATVDYETSFSSAGINQINFKIWIDVSMGIKIVSPLWQQTMTVTRKIMLVDTVISGTVPERYMTLN